MSATSGLAINAGAILRAERVRRGLTLREFAEVLGIANPVLSRYETGQTNLTLRTLEDIAERAGITLTITQE